MEVTASTKAIRISTRKVRLVADVIRDKSAQDALMTLSLIEKRGAGALAKTLKSAIANAAHNLKLSPNNLTIARLEINEGPFLKRFHPSTRGRVHSYKKRSSHIRVVLREQVKREETKKL